MNSFSSTRQKLFMGIVVGVLLVIFGIGGYLLYSKNHHSSAAFITPSPPLANSTEISLHIMENGQPASGAVDFSSASCLGQIGGVDGFFYCDDATKGIQFSDISFTSDTTGLTYVIVPTGGSDFTVNAAGQLILEAIVQQNSDGSGSETSLKKWVNGAYVDTQDGTILQQ